MAAPLFYTPGGTSGARLATRSPLAMSGRIWYVCNATGANGADAASPAGQQRSRPLLTTVQAVTNSSAGDTIQFLEGHAESLSANVTISKAGLHFISEGTSATRARFTVTAAITGGFAIGAAGVWVENISFLGATAAGVSMSIATSVGSQVVNCSFECSGFAAGATVSVGATCSQLRFVGCSWTSTAVNATSRPGNGLLLTSAITDLELVSCSFAGGTYGWADYALEAQGAVTRLVGIDCDFVEDSDMIVATGSIYKFHRRLTSGSALLELTA